MKLIVVLICIVGLTGSYASVYSQQTKLNLNVQKTMVKDVLKLIEDQSEFSFMYNASKIDVNREVDVNVEKTSVEEILKKVFAGEDVTFTVIDRNIVITPKGTESSEAQQQKSVSGKVTDSSGGTLPGVSVVVKGTTIGVITDSNGKYTLSSIPENGVLQFSFVGMKMQEIPVGGKATINVTLSDETIGISDVVVIGYGTQSKTAISTAISSINADKLINLSATNPAQAMVGQVAGVRFQQASGEPGSAPYIRIRGNGSLTSSNSPLYVIDGYPTDDATLFNAILPNDIESIDVLKDAASSAIYGSRAGNGVIQVTTKSGKLGKTRFTMDVTSGIQDVTKRYKMASPELFVEFAKEARINQGLPIPVFLNQPQRWAATDWQDVIFRTAPYQNIQLGASGGNEKMNFNLSFGYLDNQGVIINSFEKRYSMRASFNAKLTQKLKVGVNISPTYSIVRAQSATGTSSTTGVDGLMSDACSQVPILPVWKVNGDYFVTVQDDEMKGIFNTQLSNPLNKIDANLNYTYSFWQMANAFISYEPIKGLNLKSTLNAGFSNAKNEMYREAFLAYGNGNTGNISTPNLAQITAQRTNGTNLNLYWSNTASYDFKINDKHLFTALLGYDASKQDNYSVAVTPRTDIDNPVAFVNSSIKNVSGAILTSGTTAKNEYAMDAIFSRVTYSYNMKYLFSSSIRRDRSSRFGPENRTGIFPSISAAWNISKELFFDNIKYISLAKVRLSYGETGNDRLTGSYPWLSPLNKNYYNFGTVDARVLTYGPSGFSNVMLGWEKNKQFDAGMDIGFFQDRINLNLDIYERNSNTIIAASIPTINGKASTAMQNIGNVRNRGLEITFNSKNFVGPFKWQTDFNISFNRNKITALNGDSKYFGVANSYTRNYLGSPMTDIYAYKIVGTFNNAQDLLKYPKFGSQGIGDLRYEDVSSSTGVPDGKIDANDMTLIGNAQPAFTYGIKNEFQYKNFDLNILLDGSYGGFIVNQFERAITLLRQLENSIAGVAENRWQSEQNPGDGKTPRAGSLFLSSNISTSDRYVHETSFLRVRNISFGYRVPKSVIQKIGVQSLRVYFTATNLYTFTKYPGYNPEGNTTGDTATSNGYDLGSYPLSRNLSFGINLGF